MLNIVHGTKFMKNGKVSYVKLKDNSSDKGSTNLFKFFTALGFMISVTSTLCFMNILSVFTSVMIVSGLSILSLAYGVLKYGADPQLLAGPKPQKGRVRFNEYVEVINYTNEKTPKQQSTHKFKKPFPPTPRRRPRSAKSDPLTSF